MSSKPEILPSRRQNQDLCNRKTDMFHYPVIAQISNNIRLNQIDKNTKLLFEIINKYLKIIFDYDRFAIIKINSTNYKYSSYSSIQQFHCFRNFFVIFQIFICLSIFSVFGASAVRLVALNVPEQVRRGGDAELQCLYDLGGKNASLYSLKWFWRANDTDLDEKEFYRFTPTISPYKQFFSLDGIHVNTNKTDGGRLYLMNVNPRTSGRFKCEISVEGTFQTVAGEKRLSVLDFWDFYLPKSISRIGNYELDEDSEMNSTRLRTSSSQSLFTFLILTMFSLLFTVYPL